MMRGTLVVAIIAILCISAAGIGYAAVITYTGTTYSQSDINAEGYKIEIVNTDGTTVTGAIVLDGPSVSEPSETDGVTITGSTQNSSVYKLKLTVPTNVNSMKVRAKVVLENPMSWSIIDSIVIGVYATSTPNPANPSIGRTYCYTLDTPSDELPTTGTVNGENAWTWTDDVSELMELSKDNSNYLLVTVNYKSSVTLPYIAGDNLSFTDITGMKIWFVAATTDPMS